MPFPERFTIEEMQRRLDDNRVGRLHRHLLAVPILTFAGLLLLTASFYLITHRQHAHEPRSFVVIVSYDHHEQTVPSRDSNVGMLLKKLHIDLHEGDIVEPSVSTPINQEDFRVNIYRAVPVQIVDGEKKTYAFSAATTPRSIARQAGITTYAEDGVQDKPVDNFVETSAVGKQVVIRRSVPVNINLYGALTVTRTHATTVGELIQEKHIKLAKDDQVTPAQSTPLSPNTQVIIARNGTKLETLTEEIPMPVQTIQDATLAFGTSAVRQQGSAGQKITTYQSNLVNGQVVSKTVIQTVITQAPVTQIVVIGTSLSGIKGDMALAGIAPSDYNYADYIISHESGWCPTKWQGEIGYCPAYHGTPTSPYTGYGLCQATPGYKMATAGDDWGTNPVTQLKWCNSYAVSRHGGWYGAYTYWIAHSNW